MNKREIGALFEKKSAEYLIKHGYRILDKNFSCKCGEIDLIARSEGYLCFVEVKYRSNTLKGYPAESITPSKIRKITKTAEYYMLTRHIPIDTPCRFDVVVILVNEISLIKNAFDGFY